MSPQVYIDAVEKKTGKTPAALLEEAARLGYGPTTKAGVVLDWLATEYGVGRGHAMAFFHLLKNGTEMRGSTLRIDGIAARGA